MTFDEKVFIGLAACSIVAIVMFRGKDKAPDVNAVPDDAKLPPTAYVGNSNTLENAGEGPLYFMGNTRYQFWPPVNNWLPTVTSGQGAQTVTTPYQFIHRWKDAVYNKVEKIKNA